MPQIFCLFCVFVFTKQSSGPTVGVWWVEEASNGIVEVATNPNTDRGWKSRPEEQNIIGLRLFFWQSLIWTDLKEK